MSIQVIPQLGDTTTQFGAGAAQGLSEQVPKEVERYRTASGLKALGKEDLSQLNQFQAMAKLSKIPGLTPEMMGLALGEFSRQRGLQAAKQRAQSFQQGNGQSQQSGNAGEELNPNYGIPASEQELTQQTIEEMERTGKDYDTSFASVTQRDQQRVARDQGKEIRANLGRQKFDDTLETFLQKKENEIYKDIVGELQVEARNELRNAIDRGEDPTKTAVRLAKKLLDFAKVRNNLKEIGSRNFFGKSYKDIRKSMPLIRKDYEKRDRLEDFKNDLSSYLKVSPELASRIAYPDSSEYVQKLPMDTEFKSTISDEEIAFELLKEFNSRNGKKLSPQAEAQRLKNKGRNPNKILNLMKQSGNLDNLTTWQMRELQHVPSTIPPIGDFWYTSAGFAKPK